MSVTIARLLRRVALMLMGFANRLDPPGLDRALRELGRAGWFAAIPDDRNVGVVWRPIQRGSFFFERPTGEDVAS